MQPSDPEFTYRPGMLSGKKSESRRGKVAEGDVDKLLSKLKTESILLDFERVPDAFSTRGGYTAPRTGDFLIFYRGSAIALEVKEVEHDFRLPAKNLSPDSRERLRRRSRSGCHCYVAVMFKPEKLWRLAPVSYFDHRAAGSFDMSDLPKKTLQALMKELLACSQSSMMSTSVQIEAQEQPPVQS